MDQNESESTVDVVWCRDSETSCDYLLDRKTGQVLAHKDENGNIVYGSKV